MAKNKANRGASDPRRIAGRLTDAKRDLALTQQALAEILDVSQATVSKLLRGLQSPRPDLAASIESFLSSRASDPSTNDIDAVVEAYMTSESFRRICYAALELVNNNE